MVLKYQHWQVQSNSVIQSHQTVKYWPEESGHWEFLPRWKLVETVVVLAEMELTYTNIWANRYKVPH